MKPVIPAGLCRLMARRMRIATVLMVAASVDTGIAAANGPEVGFDAGGVFPVRSAHVELESEVVEVWLPPRDYSEEGRVECRYVLRNRRSGPVRFDMAFVTHGAHVESEYEIERLRRQSFEVFLANRRLESRWVPVNGRRWGDTLMYAVPDSLPAWRVEIPSKARVVLTMRYPIQWSGGCDGSDCGRHFEYVAVPAALWAGRIRDAHVNFHLDSTLASQLTRVPLPAPYRAIRVTPSNFRWRSDGVEWRFRNWEPRENLYFGFDFFDP